VIATPEGSGPSRRNGVALTVREVTKRFPSLERPAVNGVSVEAGVAEIFAVLGESGCGKTTLLRLIAGLEVPDAGCVEIGGRTVAGPGGWVPPEHRGVGMVFQDFALFPHLRVRENVAFGLRALPRPERRDRAEAMLARVGLEGYGERYPHHLSGGQKQRVALARALAPGPDLLLLDEPFSNLDVPLKVQLREMLAPLLREEGVTTVLVVHEADDVFFLADRIAVMQTGKVIQKGPPERVFADPASEYVARIFGETNLFPARRVEGGLETPLGILPGLRASGPRPVVLIRPRDVTVRSGGGEGTPAVVEEVRRWGDETRIRLSLAAEGEGTYGIVASVERGGNGLARGDRVRLGVRRGSVRVLPGSNG